MTQKSESMDEREDYCCAIVADCDCPRCRAANNQPSKYDELRTDLAAMTEARNELLRDIQQNFLPDIKRLKQNETRLTALLEDRQALAQAMYLEDEVYQECWESLTDDDKAPILRLADRIRVYLKGKE